MASIGRINPYDDGLEDWDSYVERVDQYFAVNEIGNEKKAPAILSLMGPKTYALLKSLCSPDKPGEQSYDNIVKKLKDHLNPKPLEIAERFRFHKRDQKEDESVGDFVAIIRKLTTHCNFGAFQDDMLRDRLVCGLKSEQIQNKLLTQEDLTFAKALSIAIAAETASKDAIELRSRSSAIHKLEKSNGSHTNARNRPSAQGKCYRCLGKNHSPNDCYFKSTVCNRCQKTGHIQRACKEAGKPGSRKKDRKRNNKSVHQLNDSSDNSSTESECFHLSMHSLLQKNSNAIWVEPKINGRKVKMELDTGSAVSVMPLDIFHEHFGDHKLKDTSVILKTYTGESLKPLGKVQVMVKLQKQKQKLDLFIVNEGKSALFGRSWLKNLRLNWVEIKAISLSKEIENAKDESVNLKVKTILKKYETVFDKEMGKLKDFKAHFTIRENYQPRFMKHRNVPYSLRDKVEQELARLEKEDILTAVKSSEWASPIVPVVKKNGSVRICGDFKTTVNPALKEEQYPLPKIDDIFTTLAGGKKFSKIDLSHAYQQMEVHPDHRKYLTINTHKGLFQYKRLPYGVTDAPAKWQRAIEQVLRDLENVQVILDDMIITGKDDKDHLRNIEAVLQRLKDYGLKANASKCEFFKDKIDFCGHTVDQQGLHQNEDKVKAITKAREPKNVSEVKSFTGMVNYYHKFLPNIASVLYPLHELTQKGRKFVWSKDCQKAFDEAKSLVASKKVLTHYDPKLPVVVQTDASPYGLGAVMSHVMPNGEEQPVIFLSRSLSKSERNYSQIQREATSIYWAVKKLHYFLFGRHFTLVTDHKPLTSILHPHKGIPVMTAQRLQRYALFLSGMNYTIKYRSTKEHANCDGLSRLPVPETRKDQQDPAAVFELHQIDTVPVDNKQLKLETRRDPVLSRVMDYVMTGKWRLGDDECAKYHIRKDQLSVQQGCLLWGNRVIVPPNLRQKVLKELHEAHPGVVKDEICSQELCLVAIY